MTQSAAPSTPPAPPSLPRAITPQVAKRSWHDPRVRFCWLGAIVLLAIFVYFFAEQTWIWLAEKNIIQHGTVVKAVVKSAAGLELEAQQAPHDAPVILGYTVDGKEYEQTGILSGRTEMIRPKSTVEIRVDPTNPEKWTYRKEPADLLGQLLADLSLLPLVIVVIGIAVYFRTQVLRTWKSAPAQLAVVMDTSHSPIAPRSTNLKCALPDSKNKSLQLVSVPNKFGTWKKGDLLWLLVPVSGNGVVVPAITMVG